MISRRSSWIVRATLFSYSLAWLACSVDPLAEDAEPIAGREAPDRGPPNARWEIVESMREANAQAPHPSDGGGRAWLEPVPGEPPVARVGTPGRFHIAYEVGPLGIAEGGIVFLQVSPFWNWSTPQTENSLAPGYTEIETSAKGVTLAARTLDRQLMGIWVHGRALEPGERIDVVYGAGSAGATVDGYAEKNSRFWIAVDGDGDGIRVPLADSPGVDVLPMRPARLVVILPSTARVGETVRVTVSVLDAVGNAGNPLTGAVTFADLPAGLEITGRLRFESSDAGRLELRARASHPGVYRLRAVGPEGLEAESNPLMVGEGPRILWGDLHGHSALSDGTGLPEDYFTYARDIAALDVVALTDHDHWGIRPLTRHPEIFESIRRATQRFHEPGRFVTLLGYEWTSWIHGHRHVLYFDDNGEVFDSLAPEYESPLQLWEALKGRNAMTFAHHSAGGPIATNWEIPPDPHFEPLTEITSVHGNSEAMDGPSRIYDPVPGNFVRDVLDRGYRLGFVGSGDGHDGHPGLAHLANPSGGLAAIISEDLTREGVASALRARRVYATNGPRILLRTALGSRPMGSALSVGTEGGVTEELFVHIVAPDPLERLDVIRSGKIVEVIALEDLNEIALHTLIPELVPGEYVYVRALQRNGGAAWSSPIFIDAEEP